MMEKLFDGILYNRDRERFDAIRNVVTRFAGSFIGENIIRDGIFSVVENYARKREMPLEWIRIPIEDQELCACTFIREGRIFVLLNTKIPFFKQIFAAAHELYHIRCYLEDGNDGLERNGSILKLNTIDDGTTELEEMEANAYAGLLLAPSDYLRRQMEIYQIDKAAMGMDEILLLVDVFAIPYKAMVIRLMEEQIINEDTAKELASISSEDVRARMSIIGKGKRWDVAPEGNEMLGSLEENMLVNENNETLPPSRMKSDQEKLAAIKKRYGIN